MLLQSNTLHFAQGNTALFAFGGYLFLLVIIGLYASKSASNSIEDYFIGGRKLNKYVVALSAVVSGRSAWLLLGFSGLAYTIGVSAIWAVLGYIVMEFWMFWSYAPRLRRFSEKHNVITVPDFFAARFDDKNDWIRILTATVIIIFMVFYVSAQFVAGGKAFASSFGISPNEGIIVSATVVLLYTLIGGFLAVSLTDVLQAIFMIFSLICLPILAYLHIGDLSLILYRMTQDDTSFLSPWNIATSSIIGYIGIGLGSLGSPHIMVRYMSINDPNALRFAGILGTFWNIIMALGALMVGLLGKAYYPNLGLITAGDPENIFPELANYLLNPAFFGFVIASIFAAIMSTADSQLLVAASGLVRDIYEKIIKKGQKIPDKTLVLYSRLGVLLLVIIALLFGLYATQLVFWLVLFAWGGLGASIGATSLLAIFWKGTSREGVLAGIIGGTATIFIWELTPSLEGLIYELIPSFFIALFLTFVVSIGTAPTRNEANRIHDME